jgi:hypothetical protein
MMMMMHDWVGHLARRGKVEFSAHFGGSFLVNFLVVELEAMIEMVNDDYEPEHDPYRCV